MVTFKIVYTITFDCETEGDSELKKNLLISSIDRALRDFIPIIRDTFNCPSEKIAIGIQKKLI